MKRWLKTKTVSDARSGTAESTVPGRRTRHGFPAGIFQGGLIYLVPVVIGLAVFAMVALASGRYETVTVVEIGIDKLIEIRSSRHFSSAMKRSEGETGEAGDPAASVSFVPYQLRNRTAVFITSETTDGATELAQRFLRHISTVPRRAAINAQQVQDELRRLGSIVPNYSYALEREFKILHDATRTLSAGGQIDLPGVFTVVESIRYWIDLAAGLSAIASYQSHAHAVSGTYDDREIVVPPTLPVYRYALGLATLAALAAGLFSLWLLHYLRPRLLAHISGSAPTTTGRPASMQSGETEVDELSPTRLG